MSYPVRNLKTQPWVWPESSPAAVKIGKRAFYEQAEMTLADAYIYAGRVMAENMMATDAEAGIGAFTRKEPMPPWTCGCPD